MILSHRTTFRWKSMTGSNRASITLHVVSFSFWITKNYIRVFLCCENMSDHAHVLALVFVFVLLLVVVVAVAVAAAVVLVVVDVVVYGVTAPSQGGRAFFHQTAACLHCQHLTCCGCWHVANIYMCRWSRMFTGWVLGVMGWCTNVPDNFKTVADKGHFFCTLQQVG